MPTLTYRKLIRFGDDGFVVTIPAGWVRYYGLKAGDKLQLITNGELVIRPKKRRRRLGTGEESPR